MPKLAIVSSVYTIQKVHSASIARKDSMVTRRFGLVKDVFAIHSEPIHPLVRVTESLASAHATRMLLAKLAMNVRLITTTSLATTDAQRVLVIRLESS